MMPARREALLAAAFALWGLAIAISLAPVFHAAAPLGQLPGYATQIQLDARAPLRFIAALIVLPLVLPLALRAVTRRLAADDTRPWARTLILGAVFVAAWYVSIAREPRWVIVPAALALIVATLLRRADLGFTRRDWILLPAFATTLLALVDLVPMPVHKLVVLAAAIVLAVRLAIVTIPSPLPPALAFLLAPLGLILQSSFFPREQRHLGWHALALVVITPPLLRLFLRNARRATAALALVIYPLAAYGYANATSRDTAEGKPRVVFFENGYSIGIAGEYLRGERPYRDILPVHGLLEDGLFDAAAMKIRGANAGNALHTRFLFGALNAIAIYALGAMLLGSAEAGIATYFFWQLTGSTFSLRFLPAVLTLALIAAAVRTRDRRYYLAAGVGTVICGITSLDFAAYTLIALLIAAIRNRGLKPALHGLAIAAIVLFLTFAVFGVFDDFVRGTFGEILSMGTAFTLTMFNAPPEFFEKGTFPDVVANVFRGGPAYGMLMWCAIAIATAVLLALPKRRRLEPFVMLGIWIVVSAISYAERHHLYYMAVMPALIVPAAWMAARRRSAFAPLIAFVLLILAMLTTHAGVVGWIRPQRGPVEQGLTEITDLPRARGAYFRTADAATTAAANKYVRLALQPHETYVDFTNRNLLYFLLRRDNPLRYVEVANYETESAQRAVIAAIERNPNIRAALVPPGGVAVDGVPNELRAPLVWHYIQQNFHPDFAEGDVVFWRRK